ncbi:type I-F CRISPR-associated endoribonuclease Cas6/Csy4 [Teredinibacter franksiae]|uniref:type I-F CRISPR-associated endoribonuclease Cas6/Csy4 n=1 Tax=Teredinibacter franksiae TaxID=2761453 RepID=UPI0016289962|nr:type I-F CRISPR-associated endoribonuclease Cas6/Csy4 [Teredinibacter franksiae]
MDTYIDITLKPDSEKPSNWVLNEAYTKFHQFLWELKVNDIGVSFPGYRVTLGSILRLHSNHSSLNKIADGKWLGRSSDNVTISKLQQVPINTKHRTVSRKQSNMSESKLKRILKRGSITEMEAKAYRAKMFASGLDNPYVELVSASNGNRHRRYIEFGELQDTPVEGVFDFFGLSKTATVPWF